MDTIYIASAAFVGGIASALLGWLDSQENFAARKFGASIVRALFAAIVFALGYAYNGTITPLDIGIAFIGGAGIDVLGNRVAGSIRAGIGR